MILTRHNTLLFLLNHGLLALQDLIDHPLAVRGHSQRNRGFSVTWHNGQGYYVKQHQPDAGPWEAHSSVVNEARVLACLGQGETALPGVPPLRLFDPRRQALVVDWQPDALPCATVAMADGMPDDRTAALLGGALARLHAGLARIGRSDENGQAFSVEPPWVLRFHRLHPLAGEDQSWAQARLVALIGEQEEILPELSTLADHWPTAQLIHGDMKWQNCLILADAASETDCVFIDWEMAGLGDPLWDLAGLAQSWLKAWVDGLPALPTDSEADLTARGAARFPPFQHALHRLWRSYQAARPDADAARFTRLCGARLVQTVYEENADETDLPTEHLLLLQLARNLLLRPNEGANTLLGAL